MVGRLCPHPAMCHKPEQRGRERATKANSDGSPYVLIQLPRGGGGGGGGAQGRGGTMARPPVRPAFLWPSLLGATWVLRQAVSD